jgi:uroporphyrinogen decarboxylase
MTGRLKAALGVESDRELWERLGIDRAIGVGPSIHDPYADERDGADLWGMRSVIADYGAGAYAEVAYSPLACAETTADVERHCWPDPAWWDFSGIRSQCDAWSDHPINGGGYEPFLLYVSMRGRERALEDLVLNPAVLEAALERIFHIHYEILRRTLEIASDRIDFIYVAEDLGTQNSLLMRPEHFRRFLKPRMAKMIELAHSHGVCAFHHDDGACWPLLPDLIEIGVDLLNPIQWRCGDLDRRWLKRTYGKDLIFHGAMDNQYTLPFGTVEEVRQEVRDNLAMLGEGGGYILAPCHNLQPITPIENILAMYEEAHLADG